jgi:hypothetical protein
MPWARPLTSRRSWRRVVPCCPAVGRIPMTGGITPSYGESRVEKKGNNMKTRGPQLVGIVCIILTAITSGCGVNFGPVPGPIQLSPEAELTTYGDRYRAKFMVYPEFPYKARVVSLEPPGRPSGDVATISASEEMIITSIKSSDGKVVFEGQRAGWYAIHRTPGGMRLSRVVCQLPTGTYTIGVDYSSGHMYSPASQYITQSLQRGHHYVLSCDHTETFKLLGGRSGTWKVRVTEKSRSVKGGSPRK